VQFGPLLDLLGVVVYRYFLEETFSLRLGRLRRRRVSYTGECVMAVNRRAAAISAMGAERERKGGHTAPYPRTDPRGLTGSSPARDRRLSSLAVTAAIVVALLGLTATNANANAQAKSVNRSGEITVMEQQVPTTLDPAKAATAGPISFQWPIYDRLIQLDANNNLKPMLATSWAFSPDGLTFTVNLRKDVKFNDGTPMTSADVKASVERAKTVSGTGFSVQLAPISSITTPDPYRVDFTLNQRAGNLPSVFSSMAGAVINANVLKAGTNLAVNPGRAAGSGPMVVETFSVNNRVTYVRAGNDYWDPAANQLAKLTIISVADSNARLNALQAGQANLVQVKPETSVQAKALAKQGRFAYHELAPAGQQAIYFNTRRAPFDKVELRQAVNFAIDRKAIAAFEKGDCPAANQVFRIGQPGYDPALENQFKYNQAKARQLLKSAGLTNGFSFNLTIPAGLAPFDTLAQIVQNQLAKVGIKVNIVNVDQPSQIPQFNAGQVDSMFNTLVTEPDPAGFVDKYFLSGSNLAGTVAPEIATMAIAGKDRTRPAKVWEQNYRDIAKVAGTKALYAPVCSAKAQYLFDKNLLHVKTMANQLTAGLVDVRYLALTKP
jgi:peptide/nickel transport system substrate-binding protein